MSFPTTSNTTLMQKLQMLHNSQAITLVGSFELEVGTGTLLWTDAMFMVHGIRTHSSNYISLSKALDFIHEEDVQKVERILSDTTQLSFSEFDFRIITSDGVEKNLHGWCTTITDENGLTIKRGSFQDVTKQKRLEEELVRLNEHMRIQTELMQHAEEISGSGSFEWNISTNDLKYTPNLFRLFGYTPGEIKPSIELFVNLLHPDDKVLVEASVKEAIKEGKTGAVAYRIITKNNELRHIKSNSRFIINDRNERVLVGTLKDVTDEFKQQEILSHRTTFAELIFENNVDKVAAYDKQLRFTAWNKKCEERYGLKSNEVLGKHVLEVFPEIEGSEQYKALQDALKGISTHMQERPYFHRPGFYESFIEPLKKGAEVYGVVVITHDLTEVKKAEHKLKELNTQLEERTSFAEALIETSVDAIFAYDTDLNIVAWNKKCTEIFEKDKDEVLGKHVLEVFPHLEGTARYGTIVETLDGNYFHVCDEFISGKSKVLESYQIPLVNAHNEVFGALSVMHDITDMKEAAQKLNELNRSLEQKNEELERSNEELLAFSYVASHDLQEPLRKIRSFSDRLLERENDKLSELGKDYLKRMDNACIRMQKLIDDLLSFSTVSSAAQEFVTVDLNKMIEDIKVNLKESIQESEAVITVESLPVIKAIPFQFQQMLENMIINAIKYRKPSTAATINIKYTVIDGEEINCPNKHHSKYYHRISIVDNGIGFEQQYAEKIFEIFQRLHGKQEYSGTGIGLAICKKTIQNHNGFITAIGEPGVGSTFHIYFPIST